MRYIAAVVGQGFLQWLDRMLPQIRCVSCGRQAGTQAFGIVVNRRGCSGACLHWAIEAIDQPPAACGSEKDWYRWEVSDEACIYIERICSDVNAEGCAMLTTVQLMPSIYAFGISMLEKDWIGILQCRYERFLSLAPHERILVGCPKLPKIYSVICNLHRQLQGLPTRVLTVKVAMCVDATLQVSTSTMSGHIVCEQKLGLAAVMFDHMSFVLRQFELPFRVAADYNMYTWEEFLAHYGEGDAEWKWRWANLVYDNNTVTVSEDGQEFAEERDNDLLTSFLPGFLTGPQE